MGVGVRDSGVINSSGQPNRPLFHESLQEEELEHCGNQDKKKKKSVCTDGCGELWASVKGEKPTQESTSSTLGKSDQIF